jgi:hypothetical protein
MSRVPLKYHTNIKFYTQYTHPTLFCRGAHGRTDKRTDGRTDGQTDGWMEGRTVGRTEGRTDRPTFICKDSVQTKDPTYLGPVLVEQ